jgi:tetratricopeptide (TPR) repeat protein
MFRLSIQIVGLVLALCVVPSAPVAGQEPDQVERLLVQGLEMHEAGDILGAIHAYERALEQAPDRVDVRSNLGAAYARLGRYPQAIDHYQEALAREPHHPAIRFNLALALYKGARIPEAAAELERVLAAQPTQDNARLILGDCYLQMGENVKVIERLAPHQERLGDNAVFAYVLGTAYLREKQLEQGQALIDTVFRSGDSAEAHVLMGTALLEYQDYPAAVQEFASAIQIDPKLPGVHALHGRALLGTGDPQSAERSFRRELELNPNEFEANLYLGHLRRQEQKLDEALVYLRRAIGMRPHDSTANYALASLFVAQGKNDDARDVLEQLVDQHPDFVEAHVLLATTYFRLQRKEDGERHRQIVDRLNAERQAQERGAQEGLGAPYRGEIGPRPPQ